MSFSVDVSRLKVPHIPVMLTEVMAALAPKTGEVVIDGTFGAGGYTRAILAAGCRVVALDRDPAAVLAGYSLVSQSAGQLTLVEERFSRLDQAAHDCGHEAVDGVVLDIGVSSMQLDEASRGFSFRFDGPLDMRMEQRGESAADIVNSRSEAELAAIFRVYGEEKRASALARAIVTDREVEPYTTTAALAALCGRVIRSKPGDIHPATRAFQALRILVNRELDELGEALLAAERILKPGGRLVVVSFHSLEDRIVKNFLGHRARETAGGSRHAPLGTVPPASFTVLRRGVVSASDAEAKSNPRARSAKLRTAIRTSAPAQRRDLAFLEIPSLAAASGARR